MQYNPYKWSFMVKYIMYSSVSLDIDDLIAA